jgi:hypothetical protein
MAQQAAEPKKNTVVVKVHIENHSNKNFLSKFQRISVCFSVSVNFCVLFSFF